MRVFVAFALGWYSSWAMWAWAVDHQVGLAVFGPAVLGPAGAGLWPTARTSECGSEVAMPELLAAMPELVSARSWRQIVRRVCIVESEGVSEEDEGGVGVPMFANYVFAASAALKHDKIAANWDVDGQKFSERWWFA